MDETVLLSIEKENLVLAAQSLDSNEIAQLVEWLNEKNDKIRFQALQLLQFRSQIADDVYPFCNIFYEKLGSDNSYQRSIGAMLIAENSKWDKEGRIDPMIDGYLALLQDDKPITVRQCIQALMLIIPGKPRLHQIIAEKLMAMDLLLVKETMRKLVLTDILYALLEIRRTKQQGTNAVICQIDSYISNALTGEILDKKVKKMFETILS